MPLSDKRSADEIVSEAIEDMKEAHEHFMAGRRQIAVSLTEAIMSSTEQVLPHANKELVFELTERIEGLLLNVILLEEGSLK